MAVGEAPFRRQVRAALAHLHDRSYLQTHPFGELRGKALQAALVEAVDALRERAGAGPSGRPQRLLELRYLESLPSDDVARRLGVSVGEYYREHGWALSAVASLLRERTAAPAPPGRRGALPRRIESFVGRAREVGDVLQLVAGTRLVTLIGPGGVGKTRLALEVVARLSEPAPSGGGHPVWFVELAALPEPALVPSAVAAAVGAPVVNPPTDALVDALAGREALLLLDGCEHVVEACAALVGALLSADAGGRLRVLATSREPLAVPGEVVWPVPPLAPEQAVVLFAERAAAARPGFAPTPANRGALERICARLDGLPLAIELVAARVRALTPAEIADRLEGARFGGPQDHVGGRQDRFGRPQDLDLLAAGGRGAPARHQTLRAAIDWSHDQLGEDERRLFRRLAIFAGWFDLEAAEAVAEARLDTLARLVDRSLLTANPHDDRTRYRLLETLRQYAGERLVEAGEDGVFRDRHLAHHLALAEAAEPGLWGGGERAGVERLEAAYDDLRACLDRGLATDPASALALVALLWRFWRLRGYHHEGRRWLSAAIERAPATAARRAKAMVGEATLARDLGDVAAARALAEAALPLAETAGDRQTVALALLNLCVLVSLAGDPVRAAELNRSALELCRAIGFGWGIAAALSNTAMRAVADGDLATARARFEEALGEARRLESPQSMVAILCYLGAVARRAGELEHAEALLDEAYPIALAGGHGDACGGFWLQCGWVALRRDDTAQAEALFRRALDALSSPERYGWPPVPWPLLPVYWLGVAKVRVGDVDRGVRLIAAGQDAGQRGQSELGTGWGLSAVAEVALELARAALPGGRFEALWTEGSSMTSAEALTHALEGPADS